MVQSTGVCLFLLLSSYASEINSTIYDCKCNGIVCRMVLEAAAVKECHNTNTDLLTLPFGLLVPAQKKVELAVSNLNLLSTSGMFQNNATEDLQKIVKIDLSGNQMTELKDNEFSAVVNLEDLNIGNNKLHNIQEKAFFGLTKLKKLALWVNQLTKLSGTVLAQLSSLVELNLHSNRLTQLDVCIFRLAKNLKLLFLESNDIQIIQKCAADSGVEQLYLHKNHLTTLEDLKNFPNLKILNVGSNPNLRLTSSSFSRWRVIEYLAIDNIDLEGSVKFAESLNEATTLREISMSNNRLEKFSVAEFPHLAKLVTLRIEDNRLTQFDYELLRAKFPIMNQIDITGNRWDCEYLKDMIGDLKKQGIKLLNVSPRTDQVINVDGITCFADKNVVSFYGLVLIALGVAIVFVAICLFFVQIYMLRRRRLREQSLLQIRTKTLY